MLVSRVGAILLAVCASTVHDQPDRNIEAASSTSSGQTETVILSERDVERLRRLEGITLQWISWDRRGKVSALPEDSGLWRLSGTQFDQSGAGLRVIGTITQIGEDYFLLDGRIQIGDTPDIGRSCDATKVWRFEVTQNRTYYRLREFEWCDDLTDYVDIYFAPSLR